jgi:hypothetical protein
LQDAVLVRAEFLELGLEELVFLASGGFFIQNEYVTDIVGVDLCMHGQ